jgi:ComF family protein
MNLSKVFLSFFDFILPRFCTSCSKKLSLNEKAICKSCLSSIQIASVERIQSEYDRKFKNDRIIAGFYSNFVFEKDKVLQKVIHSLKYEKRFQNGTFLGEVVGKAINGMLEEWKIDFLIPIPLHPIKKAERGYNQSYYIAKGISGQTGTPVKNNLVKRARNTKSQTTMTLIERKENVDSAFSIKNKNMIIGKNILLVDDVITTGATTSECGKELIKAGANNIYAAAIAIAD